jgi:hypothetical protein
VAWSSASDGVNYLLDELLDTDGDSYVEIGEDVRSALDLLRRRAVRAVLIQMLEWDWDNLEELTLLQHPIVKDVLFEIYGEDEDFKEWFEDQTKRRRRRKGKRK